jgi:hypothetical protein
MTQPEPRITALRGPNTAPEAPAKKLEIHPA